MRLHAKTFVAATSALHPALITCIPILLNVYHSAQMDIKSVEINVFQSHFAIQHAVGVHVMQRMMPLNVLHALHHSPVP
jgi:hypothetical protein